ncbi:MAG: hypothetical protein OEZ01_05160 [Candidatus Heimdallarchaeota archaeon]|nr:hypothetical protein [Candidatus Heimdallarchaeota archaeon]
MNTNPSDLELDIGEITVLIKFHQKKLEQLQSISGNSMIDKNKNKNKISEEVRRIARLKESLRTAQQNEQETVLYAVCNTSQAIHILSANEITVLINFHQEELKRLQNISDNSIINKIHKERYRIIRLKESVGTLKISEDQDRGAVGGFGVVIRSDTSIDSALAQQLQKQEEENAKAAEISQQADEKIAALLQKQEEEEANAEAAELLQQQENAKTDESNTRESKQGAVGGVGMVIRSDTSGDSAFAQQLQREEEEKENAKVAELLQQQEYQQEYTKPLQQQKQGQTKSKSKSNIDSNPATPSKKNIFRPIGTFFNKFLKSKKQEEQKESTAKKDDVRPQHHAEPQRNKKDDNRQEQQKESTAKKTDVRPRHRAEPQRKQNISAIIQCFRDNNLAKASELLDRFRLNKEDQLIYLKSIREIIMQINDTDENNEKLIGIFTTYISGNVCLGALVADLEYLVLSIDRKIYSMIVKHIISKTLNRDQKESFNKLLKKYSFTEEVGYDVMSTVHTVEYLMYLVYRSLAKDVRGNELYRLGEKYFPKFTSTHVEYDHKSFRTLLNEYITEQLSLLKTDTEYMKELTNTLIPPDLKSATVSEAISSTLGKSDYIKLIWDEITILLLDAENCPFEGLAPKQSELFNCMISLVTNYYINPIDNGENILALFEMLCKLYQNQEVIIRNKLELLEESLATISLISANETSLKTQSAMLLESLSESSVYRKEFLERGRAIIFYKFIQSKGSGPSLATVATAPSEELEGMTLEILEENNLNKPEREEIACLIEVINNTQKTINYLNTYPFEGEEEKEDFSALIEDLVAEQDAIREKINKLLTPRNDADIELTVRTTKLNQLHLRDSLLNKLQLSGKAESSIEEVLAYMGSSKYSLIPDLITFDGDNPSPDSSKLIVDLPEDETAYPHTLADCENLESLCSNTQRQV